MSGTIRGAEPWSSPGRELRARVGVMVLHGFTGNPVTTRPLGEAIAAAGYAVEVPCLPGHGTRWRDMVKTSYDDWRRASEQVLDRLRARCDRVIVGGLSMGGLIALDLATRRHDDVAGVFSINAPVLDREGLLARLAPLVARVLVAAPASAAGLIKNDIAKPGGEERAYAWVPSRAGASVVREIPRIRARLGGLDQPILVAYSPQDHSVPPASSKALLRLVGSKDVTELVLERSYHVATLDYDRELLEQKVIAFVQRVTGL